MDDISRRAEAARAKILASGNPDLINQLHLMEAAQAGRAAPPQGTRGQAGGGAGGITGGLGLGTVLAAGAAVAGGAWLGASLAALSLDDEMQEAFATLAADLGIDMDAGADGGMEGFDAAEGAEGGFFDDLGLGDIFDI